MTSLSGAAIDPQEPLEQVVDDGRLSFARELRELLPELLGGAIAAGSSIRLEPLKKEVFRLRVGDACSTLVLKRFAPAVGQSDRLVAERWLPALGLTAGCPRLLASATTPDGRWVWHVYEDLGDESLAVDRAEPRVAAAVELIADLHTRAAGHPMLPEARWRAHDYGPHFFTANLRDAITALEFLDSAQANAPQGFSESRRRLQSSLQCLLEDAPRRCRVLEEAGGPDTLLHGDLWPTNVFVATGNGNAPQVRLIDWDHVGVGKCSYDLSTMVYRAPLEQRPYIVRRYREAVQPAGWCLPDTETLNLLFHTAESARYAHCILFDAMAVLNDGVERAFEELMDYERWLAALEAPLPP